MALGVDGVDASVRARKCDRGPFVLGFGAELLAVRRREPVACYINGRSDGRSNALAGAASLSRAKGRGMQVRQLGGKRACRGVMKAHSEAARVMLSTAMASAVKFFSRLHASPFAPACKAIDFLQIRSGQPVSQNIRKRAASDL